jgi:hypothetical protein
LFDHPVLPDADECSDCSDVRSIGHHVRIIPMTQFNLSILDYPSKLDMTISVEMPEETVYKVAQIIAGAMSAALTPARTFGQVARYMAHLAEYTESADSMEIHGGAAFDGISATLSTVDKVVSLPSEGVLADVLRPLATIHGFSVTFPNRVVE